MKTNFIKKMALGIGAACFCASLAIASPLATIQSQAASVSAGPVLKAKAVGYAYMIKDGALYKRLYNYSTGKFLSDWIFVRYLTEEDYDHIDLW